MRRWFASHMTAGQALTDDEMCAFHLTTFSTHALFCTLGVERQHETRCADSSRHMPGTWAPLATVTLDGYDPQTDFGVIVTAATMHERGSSSVTQGNCPA